MADLPDPPVARVPDILSIEACRLRSWLAAAQPARQPARGSRQHPGAAHRRVHGASCWRLQGPGYLVAVGYLDPGNWQTMS